MGDLSDWHGARAPAREPIEGTRVRLVALRASDHAEDLFRAARDDGELWRYLPYGPFADAASYADWIEANAAGPDPLFFAVVDGRTGAAGGVVSYLRAEPAHGVIEIGHIWFGRALRRTPEATEAIFLLMGNAFDGLGNRRLEWKCNAANERSMSAARRFGFTYEGTFRQHLVVKQRNRDTAWFSLLDREWPRVRAAFEDWLEPANFDADGTQRTRLRV